MASTFPTTLDVLSNPPGATTMSAHADQHANANDAIEAIEARIGVAGTAVAGTVEKRLADVIAADAATAMVAAAALPSAGLAAALTAANVVTSTINGVTGGVSFSAGGQSVSLGGGVSASWSTVWDMLGYKDLGDKPVAGALAITSDDTGAVVGGCTQAVLIANGANIPTFDGATISDYQNTNGARNLVQLFRAGSSKFWAVGSRLGAAMSVASAPLIGVAPSIITALAGSPLTFSAASSVTGSPTPTITYDALVGGSVVSSGITSGSYTPPTAGVSITVRATATNASGSVTSTSGAATVAAAATAPGQVAGLTLGTATSTTQPLTWTAPATGGSAITDYVVQWAVAGSGTWNTFADGTSATASATVTGLTASTSYDYRVSAVNAVGTGTNSATATGSTAAASAGLRMAELLTATESGTGPYTYTATANSAAVGTPNLSLAAAADGEIQAALSIMPSGFAGVGFGTTAAAGVYSTFLYLLYANSNLSGTGTYKVGLNGTTGVTGNGADSATIPSVGDILRISRTGSSISFQVAREASPTTWLTLHSIASGGSTAQLYPRGTMSVSTSAFQFSSHVGLT